MTDCYNYLKSSKARSAKFVSVQFNYSDAVRAMVKKELADKYEITDDATAQKRMGCWYDVAVHRKLSEKESFSEVS